MPLISCPDCEKQISDAAPVCVHCGRLMLSAAAEPVKITGPVLGLCSACGTVVTDDPGAWYEGELYFLGELYCELHLREVVSEANSRIQREIKEGVAAPRRNVPPDVK